MNATEKEKGECTGNNLKEWEKNVGIMGIMGSMGIMGEGLGRGYGDFGKKFFEFFGGI